MREPLGRRSVQEHKRKGLKLSIYILLIVEAIRSIVLRLYRRSKEGKQSVSVVLHSTLAMKISIMPKEPVDKRNAP